jgi:hypothetical protein
MSTNLVPAANIFETAQSAHSHVFANDAFLNLLERTPLKALKKTPF